MALEGKRLEFSVLLYVYVNLSYGTQRTYGFEIILFFCFCFFFWFLCILTGVATTIHQVIMASDFLPPSEGMHAHPCSFHRAMPGDWFPGASSAEGSECAGIASAKWCSESLKHQGGESCATRSLIDIIKYQVTKMVPRVGESPALIPSLMSCSGWW